MFSAVHPITDLGTAEGIVIRRAILDADCDCTAANPRSPAAPPSDLQRQFKFEFNNYFRSALTLRRLSSTRGNVCCSMETRRVLSEKTLIGIP